MHNGYIPCQVSVLRPRDKRGPAWPLFIIINIIIIIKLSFLARLNKKNLARKGITEEREARITKTNLNEAAS